MPLHVVEIELPAETGAVRQIEPPVAQLRPVGDEVPPDRVAVCTRVITVERWVKR